MNHDRFKVGTFNLYNLVLPEVNYYDQRRYSKDEYHRKIDWIAGQLDNMAPDIVGFQEIFHQAALDEALQASRRCRGYNLVVANENGQSPVVGLATQYPILEHGFVGEFPEQARLNINDTAIPITHFSRPVLWVKIQITAELVVTVFVTHLKSKNPLIPDGRDRHDPLERAMGKARSLILRAAEATALRALLLDYITHNENAVIVMGDINDAGRAVTSEIMTGSPPWRRLPYRQKLSIWDVQLYNVKDIQARQSYRDVYYSHIHNGHYESLDHILVSEEFVRENPVHLGYVEYVKVFNDHLIDETLSDEEIPGWQSDHGQVTATIRVRHD